MNELKACLLFRDYFIFSNYGIVIIGNINTAIFYILSIYMLNLF